MIHAFITFAFCFPCLFLGASWPFFFWPPAFYLGREYAQAEERYMKARNINRKAAPWWMGVAPSAWTRKGLLDFLLPLAVSIASTVIYAAVL